jgi:lipoyl(octanoyl) transferase
VRDVLLVRAGQVPYVEAWSWQRTLHARRVDDRIPDTVLLLEHEPVYTAGRRTTPDERPVDGTAVVEVDRGGKITWHGPGQLTGYPILRLDPLPGGGVHRDGPVDVVAHVRRLEDALIRVCAEFGVAATRVTGRSGVWVAADDRGADRKVAAIGIRVSRGVTMHGFALNADCNLTVFDRIVACGIRDAGVTSLTVELGRPVSVADVLPVVERNLCAVFGANGVPASVDQLSLEPSLV